MMCKMNPDIVTVSSHASGLVWITVQRPEKHNALARNVLTALAEAVQTFGADPKTRCILLRGAGDLYFAAGGDLLELSRVRSEVQIDAMADGAVQALDAVRNCPIPVIAYVNGDAIGGGAELAVACDMRLMAPHARIGFIQGRLGLTSTWGGGPDLCELVGPARAMRMMARCEMVNSQLALDWGLAELEVKDGPEGEDLAGFLKPILACTREVLCGIKAQTAAFRRGLPQKERRSIERRNIQITWASDAHWAAIDRFLAKQKI
jgi:enoyl-CoA hydratase/carnithine racemase